LIAILLFVISLSINFIFDTVFVKDFFNSAGYNFNLFLYNLNIQIQQTVAHDPLAPKIPLITSPVTAEFIKSSIPWFCLRGYLVSAFITGMLLTVIQKKKLNLQKIIPALFITGLFQLALYALPHNNVLSSVYFLDLNQPFYFSIPVLLIVCLAGLFSGFDQGNNLNN